MPRLLKKKSQSNPVCKGCRFYNTRGRYCGNGIDTFTKKFRCAFKNVSRYLRAIKCFSPRRISQKVC